MRLLAVLAFAASLALPVAASDTDTFNVQGTTPDGKSYTGTVTLTELKPSGKVAGDVFSVTWTIGGGTTEGIAMVDPGNRHVLYISYISGGAPGLAVMTEEDGSAKGIWYAKGAPGTGTEVWTPIAKPSGGGDGVATEAAITYERAVLCAAATAYLTGTLRSTPGADAAKIDAYDKANSAWTIKLGEVGADKDMGKRIDDVRAKQGEWANDPDGIAKATPIADDCVVTAPPIE